LLVVVVVGVVALLLLRLTSPEVGLGVATAPAPDEEAGEYGKEEEETDPENDPADNHVPDTITPVSGANVATRAAIGSLEDGHRGHGAVHCKAQSIE